MCLPTPPSWLAVKDGLLKNVSKYLLFTSKYFLYIATVLRDKEHWKYILEVICFLEMNRIILNVTYPLVWAPEGSIISSNTTFCLPNLYVSSH